MSADAIADARRARLAAVASPPYGAGTAKDTAARGISWKNLPGALRNIVGREVKRLIAASKTKPLDDADLARLDRLTSITAKLTTIRTATERAEQEKSGAAGAPRSASEMTDAELAAAAGK